MYKRIGNQQMMTDEEQKSFYGLDKKSIGSQLVKSDMMKSTLVAMLGQKISTTLDDGTKVEPTVLEKLVAATLKEAMDNPSTQKLKDITQIMGELQDKHQVEVTGNGQSLFGDIALNTDGTEYLVDDTNKMESG